MILQVVSAFDSKTAAFCTPFYVAHLEIALRAFSDAVNDPSHELHKHAPDFMLFHLGTFDDQTGVHDRFPQPKNLGSAVQFKRIPAGVHTTEVITHTEPK